MRDTLQQANQTLLEAETKLRRLMETALTHQRYADVAALAPLADALLNLIGTVSNGTTPNEVSADLTDITDRAQELNIEKRSPARWSPSVQRADFALDGI